MKKRISGRWLAVSVAAAFVAALSLSGAALADHDEGYNGTANSHQVVGGNPRCPEGTRDGYSIKIESGQLGNGLYFGNAIQISNYNGTSFDWKLVGEGLDKYDARAVIVKGGPVEDPDGDKSASVVYLYEDADDDSDTGLTAPRGDDGKLYGISHVEFCFDPKSGAEPGDLSVTKTANGAYDLQHSYVIDKVVKPVGAADGTYSDNVVLNLPDGGNGGVTWKVTVVHDSEPVNLALSGSITVTNTGGLTVEDITVTDPGAVVDCAPDGEGNGMPFDLAASASKVCSYSGTPATQVQSNTATATAGETSASGSAPVSWVKGSDLGVPAEVEDDGEIEETLDLEDFTDNTWTTTYDERWTCANGVARNGDGAVNNARLNIASVEWVEGYDEDSAAVQVGCGSTPPPQLPPPRQPDAVDLQLVKDATGQVNLVNGSGTITYTVTIKNNGPNQANGVTVTDDAPAGVTFTGVTQQPTGGTCSTTPTKFTCDLGTLGFGVVRTATFTGTVSAAGTYVNKACVAGTNETAGTANNCDEASTLVIAPITPPTPPVVTPEPKPEVKPTPKPVQVCLRLEVKGKKVIGEGARSVISFKVTAKKKPQAKVGVLLKGAGIYRVVKTGKNGVVLASVKPGKSGIITATITSNKRGCNSARIGVVGAFEPPVTG